jgi:phage-related protein
VGILLGIRGVVISVFDTMKPVIFAVGAAFAAFWPSIQPLLPELLNLAMALSPIHLIFTALGPMLPTLIGTLGTLAATLAGALGQALAVVLPIITQLAGMLAGELMKIVVMLVPVIVKLVEVIGPVLGTVLAAVAPVIGMLAEYLGQLVQMIVPLIPAVMQMWMAFLPITELLWQLIGAILPPLIQLLMFLLMPMMAIEQWLVSLLVPAIQLLAVVITWIVENAIKGFVFSWQSIITVVNLVGGVIGTVFGAIGGIIMGAFNGVVGFVKGIFNTIIGLVNGIIDGINGATSLAGAIGIHIGAIPHLPKLKDGATILPRPGGTVAVLAEAGRAETIVDTGKLNRRLDQENAAAQKGGDIMPNTTIYMTPDKSVAEYAQEQAWYARSS